MHWGNPEQVGPRGLFVKISYTLSEIPTISALLRGVCPGNSLKEEEIFLGKNCGKCLISLAI